jgi:DNA polymerase-3 subunit epsilon
MSETLASMRFAVVDTETTGLSPATCSVLQLGIVIVRGDGTIENQFSTYIKRRFWKPGRLGAHHIHGITRRQLRTGISIHEALDRLHTELKTATFVAHNAKFDLGFLRAEAQRCGHPLVINNPICTLTLSRSLDPSKSHPHNLRQLAIRYGITDVPNHDALADAVVTARLLPILLAQANITSAEQVASIALK